MADAILHGMIGFMLGSILFDTLWRWLSRKQSALIEEQKTLIGEQHAVLVYVDKLISKPNPRERVE